MPQRERLYAVFRLLGYLNRIKEEAVDELRYNIGQLLLEDIYSFNIKREEDVEALLEGIKRSMGLSDDDQLVRMLRNVAPRDSGGKPARRR